ncbi:MAG: hypothetical protein A2X34_09610 [Elusimicrobia bacterium GWC2_51_8]|nr:MAG: hypothetical protein A2X33_04090 [Elusimicrobia bacterium GWA2_51_34]OGR61122.1 MAG: hypothetical protein A2X34_09610 [Elusimicrobia bacterium GWC2_51_8]OGR85933.1 MAG: hypothetical protein A2021_04265 [Elusimicrobia bacterium GWF2_52_66]HAF96511.1 hypothetical protein [Elusimicrobiota bacterium]HCE97590.1 hypothetical protein [Elusimicrobiota bacterium]
MKLVQIAVLAAAVSLGGSVIAQAAATPAKGLKITKITGTVNIMKDGVIVMTLKPGDSIPEIKDNQMTFAVVEGSMELQAGGKAITAGAGANFSVTSNRSEVEISVTAGAPVAIKSESGHNVVLTPNTTVSMVNTRGKVEISVEKGNAVVSNASGGETQSVKAGETASIPAMPPAPIAAAAPAPAKEEPEAEIPAETPADAAVTVPVTEPPPTTVIQTQTVEEATEVSGSNP